MKTPISPVLWSSHFLVGSRYRCEITASRAPGGMLAVAIDWDPGLPRALSDFEMDQYRRGRDACVLALARETGHGMATVEPNYERPMGDE